MKDNFFKYIYLMYVHIYRFVMKVVYTKIDRKRASDCRPLNRKDKVAIRRYWKRFGIKPKLDDYKLYVDRGLNPDPALIPTEVWTGIIEPNHNVLKYCEAFADKNYFDLILGKENTPLTVLRCISGSFLDDNYASLSIEQSEKLLQSEGELILKPSIDSGGGRDVCKIHGSECTIKKLEEYRQEFSGNFCIQEVFEQHPFLKSLNESSVQSIRVISFFSKQSVEIFCASMRMGKPGNIVDNFVSGGYAVSIDVETGRIGDRLVDHDMRVYTAEECGLDKAGFIVPHWEEAKRLVKILHPRLAHFGIIGWDVTIDASGRPKIIEYNLLDSIVDWHQVFIGPLLGDKTEKILPVLLKQNPYV